MLNRLASVFDVVVVVVAVELDFFRFIKNLISPFGTICIP